MASDINKQLAQLQEPPIYVVPDNMMPQKARYGGEVQRKSPEEYAQDYSSLIRQRQATTPIYSPFPAGTKTLTAKEAEENKRRYDQEWDYRVRQDALDRVLRSSGGGGSGISSDLPRTVGERQDYYTNALYNRATEQYLLNRSLGAREEQVKGQKTSKSGQYPLYYTISSILKDPIWQPVWMQKGANVKSVIDKLIADTTNLTPEQYFNTPQGSKLKASYEAAVQKQIKQSEGVEDAELVDLLKQLEK